MAILSRGKGINHFLAFHDDFVVSSLQTAIIFRENDCKFEIRPLPLSGEAGRGFCEGMSF